MPRSACYFITAALRDKDNREAGTEKAPDQFEVGQSRSTGMASDLDPRVDNI